MEHMANAREDNDSSWLSYLQSDFKFKSKFGFVNIISPIFTTLLNLCSSLLDIKVDNLKLPPLRNDK